MKNIFITVLVLVVAALGWVVFTNWDSILTDESSSSTDVSKNNTKQPSATGNNFKSLASSNLSAVPIGLFDDTKITELDLSGNNLTGALPSQLGKLSNLEVLNASDNKLTGIPAEIGQLSKLRVINFANNDISGLPLELENLNNLETLDLRGNPNVSFYDISLIQPKIPNANILTDAN